MSPSPAHTYFQVLYIIGHSIKLTYSTKPFTCTQNLDKKHNSIGFLVVTMFDAADDDDSGGGV